MKISSVSFKWQLAHIDQAESCNCDMQGHIYLPNARLPFPSQQMGIACLESKREHISHVWLFPRPFQLKIIASDGFVISQSSWLSCSEEIKAGGGPAEGLQTHTLKGRASWPESQDSHRCLGQCVYSWADLEVFERSFLGSPHVAGLVIMLGETFQMKWSRRG